MVVGGGGIMNDGVDKCVGNTDGLKIEAKIVETSVSTHKVKA